MAETSRSIEASVAALTQYFVANQTLGETLHQVAALTIDALPQTTHVGVTLLVENRLKTSVFTHPEVLEVDQAQYRTGDGPCIDAYREARPYRIVSTREPGRWQEFRDSAAQHGVLSTLSLPLMTREGAIGAINLYAAVEDAYQADDLRTGELFAAQAAFLLANAAAYWDARTLSENLEQAMASRATIEQAKGIIMATMRCDAEQAMRTLIQQSQSQNVKLREIAAEIVANTARPRSS